MRHWPFVMHASPKRLSLTKTLTVVPGCRNDVCGDLPPQTALTGSCTFRVIFKVLKAVSALMVAVRGSSPEGGKVPFKHSAKTAKEQVQ